MSGVRLAWGMVPLGALRLFYPARGRALSLVGPGNAVGQCVFSVASAVLVSAACVFCRDRGHVVGHLLRLWWFMSPGLYGLALLDEINFVQTHPWVKVVFGLNPFAVLFEAYHSVIYGSPDGPPFMPNPVPLLALLVGSLVLLALGTIFFKRLEPDFAKVL